MRLLSLFFAVIFLFYSIDLYAESYYRYQPYSNSNVRYYSKPRPHVHIKKTTYKYRARSHTRMAKTIAATGEKVIIIDPNTHAWGAYSPSGKLLRSGRATAGSNWCRDVRRACRTKSGSFRIQSLGSWGCKSSKYPLGKGGAPMPYCMFFNGHQGLHGSYEVVAGNISHGCVRVPVGDAKWIRFNFATIGTKVVVRPY